MTPELEAREVRRRLLQPDVPVEAGAAHLAPPVPRQRQLGLLHHRGVPLVEQRNTSAVSTHAAFSGSPARTPNGNEAAIVPL